MYNKLKKDTLTARLVCNKNPTDETTIKKNTMLSILSDCESKGKLAKRPPTNEECVSVLKSFLKKCNQFIEDVTSSKEPNYEKLKTLNLEKQLCLSYLPKELTDDEILNIVKTCPTLSAAMKKLKSEHFGEYDGKNASKICREHFNK